MGRGETGRALKEAHEALAAMALRMAAANKRMAELESELALARQQSSRLASELYSVKKALDRSEREKVRLDDLVLHSAPAIEKRKSQLAQLTLALKEAETCRDEAVNAAREQVSTLSAQLEAVTARAVAAERLASATQRNLLALSAENSSTQSSLAATRISLQEKQISLQEKENQVQAFRQGQVKLVELVTSREAALLRAEERIAALAEQLQAKAAADRQASKETVHPAAAKPGAELAPQDCAILKRDLDDDAWLFGGEFSRAA